MTKLITIIAITTIITISIIAPFTSGIKSVTAHNNKTTQIIEQIFEEN